MTERRNERSTHLDQMTSRQAVDLFVTEERQVELALKKASHEITQVVEWATGAIRAGGRIIYVGAGTSGRLGVLDASECPPTFGVEPSRVVGLIAGGRAALTDAVEGAEDDAEQGAADLASLQPSAQDLVIGIAASGGTPYVQGAFEKAKDVDPRIKTALVCCNPDYPSVPHIDAAIRLETGPELLTGSTRLKAGTATKAVLNMITTLAFAHSGRVIENLMVDVQATNAKLRKRALRIVMTLTGLGEEAAAKLLESAGGSAKKAVLSRRG